MPNKLLLKLHKGQTFFKRLDRDYYLAELKTNAFRRKRKEYDKNRKEEIHILHQKRRKINKGLPLRKWSKKEINFLKKNYRTKDYVELAKIMKRSTGSIEHKVLRLGLRKNYQWLLIKK